LVVVEEGFESVVEVGVEGGFAGDERRGRRGIGHLGGKEGELKLEGRQRK